VIATIRNDIENIVGGYCDCTLKGWQASLENAYFVGAAKPQELANRLIKYIEELQQTPANTVELPAMQHILSRDQRDALVAANVFLSILQNDRPELFDRIQPTLDEISNMLYSK
jgi:hypothetical protein